MVEIIRENEVDGYRFYLKEDRSLKKSAFIGFDSVDDFIKIHGQDSFYQDVVCMVLAPGKRIQDITTTKGEVIWMQ